MMKSEAMLVIACVALVTLVVGCDTPPVSPANAGATAIAPAHASPDPPPARQVIVEDGGAARGDAGAFDGGGGGVDASATDVDGGAAAAAAADGGALDSAWLSTVTGADATVTSLRPKLRACYTRSIKGRPQGRLVLHANVAADGSISSVTAGQTEGVTGRVVACMVDVLKGAHLPAPGRVTTLDVPVSFQTP